MEDQSTNDQMKKGRVCVTGGTGYVASWLVMRLLQHGYSVNTTIRPGRHKDISFLTSLPGASQNLRIFNAEFEDPDSFAPAIEGCVGVFHTAHPIDLENKEAEETVTAKSVGTVLSILKACVDSKTVKKVVYTSSVAAVMINKTGAEVVDERTWTDVDFTRSLNLFEGSYANSKTVTERTALEFAEKHSLDLVTVLPSWIHGPFICSTLPGSVKASLALILGNENCFKCVQNTPFVHIDDVASAHIFLFENPESKGRYICSAVEITVDKLFEFVTLRYPELRILDKDSLTSSTSGSTSFSSKKLLDTGFKYKYKYGLEEMYDGAIECCKKKGIM